MRDKLVPLVSAAIVVLLQIVLAPIISFFSIVPNFIVAFVIVLSIVRNADTTYLYAFVLGLISDLLSQVPLGLTPLLLLLISFALSRAFEVMDKSSFVTVLLACLVAVLLYQLLVVIVLLIQGYPASIFDMLLARVLPATLFNFIICALLYLVARKFPIAPSGNEAWAVDDSARYR